LQGYINDIQSAISHNKLYAIFCFAHLTQTVNCVADYEKDIWNKGHSRFYIINKALSSLISYVLLFFNFLKDFKGRLFPQQNNHLVIHV
jgi:hypothetical protein